MSSKPHKSRDACEHCHRRKIRCVLEPDSRACQVCTANADLCIFAPRSKPGRPRRVNSSFAPSDSNESDQSHLNRPQHQVQFQQASENYQEAEASYFSPMDQEGQPYIGDFAMPSFWRDFQGNNAPTLPNSTSNGSASSTPQILNQQQQTLEKNPTFQEIVPYQAQSCLMSPVATPILSEANLTKPISSSNTSDSTLVLYAELDGHYRLLKLPQKGVENVNDIVTCVELACSSAMTAIESPTASTCASTALGLAAVLKALDLCQSLVLRLSQDTKAKDFNELEHLLLLKRLDLALLKARIFLVRSGHSEAAEKCLQIHHLVASVGKEQYQSWGW